MSKHESACAAYVRANAEVSRIGALIGEKLNACISEKQMAALSISEAVGARSCLSGWFDFINSEGNQNEYGGWEMHPSEITAQDDICGNCLEAYRLIQQRKAARQALGAAKRQITVLGKKTLAFVGAGGE